MNESIGSVSSIVPAMCFDTLLGDDVVRQRPLFRAAFEHDVIDPVVIEGQAVDLEVELEARDALGGAGDLEVLFGERIPAEVRDLGVAQPDEVVHGRLGETARARLKASFGLSRKLISIFSIISNNNILSSLSN